MLEDKVMTATREELTLMLYEGGIKFLNRAIMAVEKKDMTEAHAMILKSQDVVREFQLTLDHKYPISQELDTLYDYMHRRLVDANIRKDLEILNEVLGMFREFRDTWKEAMKLAKVN
ncbi:MAG: flagellar export chaperone FliS [Defluviitaleaceae bacterium]|nr:flagellar export chaperone FliS [Defluviitaleaceae bacterium]